MACRAADVIVESLPRKATRPCRWDHHEQWQQGKVVWLYGKRRVGFSGPGMRVIRPEGRVGGVVPLTNMAWTDALGRTNVIGFNMSEADETVTFQGKDDGPLPRRLRRSTNQKRHRRLQSWCGLNQSWLVVVKVDPENYPITCRNFLAYVDAGFYEDTLFHRVISGFMVQGGGFDTEMRRKKLRPHSKRIRTWPHPQHPRTIAWRELLLRTRPPVSFTSTTKTTPSWTMARIAFGRVVEGMSTIDAIAKERTTVRLGMPTYPRSKSSFVRPNALRIPLSLPRIGILLNPRAGRGLAPAYAKPSVLLFKQGFEPVVRGRKDAIRLPDEIERAIVVGGDGTLRRAAAALGEVGVPFLHAPLGTENLFARMLHLPREPEDIAELAVRGGTRRIDAGRTPYGPFTLMVSVGFDAEVIHDLHARRHGPIRHASYIAPILRTALRRKWPKVSIDVDGQLVVEQRRGLAIVANFSGYAFGMDPARDAQPDDGLWMLSFCPPHPSLGRCCGRGVPAAASPWITRRQWLPVVPVSRCRGPKRWPSNWMAMLPDCRTRWTSRCFPWDTR